MNTLKAKGIKAFMWDLGGKLSIQGMGFIITIILARLLEPSDFGLIAMIMVVIGITQVFTDVGLGGALIQRRKLLPIHYSSVFYFNILIATCLTLITYFSADLIATFYDNRALTPLTQSISFLFIISALSSVQAIRLRKQLNYTLLTKVSFISSLLSGVIGVLLAVNGAGVWSLMVQVILQGIFYNLIIWNYSEWKPSLAFSFKALKQLWKFGFRMFLSGVLDAVFTRLDFLIIGKVFSASTLGYFQLAKQFNSLVIKYSSGSLMAVMFPLLSQVQKDLPRFRNIILKSLNILCFVVFLLLGCLYLTAEELVIFLFTDKWLPSVEYMQILILSGFGIPISSLLVNVLSSRGNSKAFLNLEILKKSLHVFNFINAYYNGIEMYLYGLILVTIFSVSLNIIFAKTELKMSAFVFFKPIVIQMLIGVIATIATYQINDFLTTSMLLGFIIKSTLFTFLFLSINMILRTESFNEVRNQVYPILKNKLRFKC